MVFNRRARLPGILDVPHGTPLAELDEVVVSDHNSGTQILNGVSFTAMRGEVVLITGPSGSGKSTALRTLEGLERPDRGTARVLGQDLASMSTSAISSLKRHNVGIVFQASNLATNQTVFENLVSVAEANGQYDMAAAARADMLVNRLGLADRVWQKAATLSGGQKMRVAIGRSLVAQHQLLLLDEPTGAVDPAGKAGIFEFLRETGEKGTTIVMVSHDEMARDYATREVQIYGGEVVADSVLDTQYNRQ